MSLIDLDAVFDTGGISLPNFFNGRILAAEDLQMLLEGDQDHRRLLGRAIGPGVANGLRVSAVDDTNPLLAITAGLAVNRYGETIDLPIDITVDTTKSTSTTVGTSAGIFVECAPTAEAPLTGNNAFLLTVRPDAHLRDSAPSDVVTSGVSCGPGRINEGVRFRKIPIDPATIADLLGGTGAPDVTTPSGFNRTAHALLDADAWLDQLRVPEQRTLREPAWDRLGIEACEVPLALFVAEGRTITTVDMWCVRRSPAPHQAGAVDLAEPLLTATRQTVGMSAVRHFHSRLDALLAAGIDPTATSHMPWLPAAGILPPSLTGGPTGIADFVSRQVGFFGALADPVARPVQIGEVERILRQGAEMPPIAVDSRDFVRYSVALLATTTQPLTTTSAVFWRHDHPRQCKVEIDELREQIEILATAPPPETDERTIDVYRALRPQDYLGNTLGRSPANGGPLLRAELSGAEFAAEGAGPDWYLPEMAAWSENDFRTFANRRGSWSEGDAEWALVLMERAAESRIAAGWATTGEPPPLGTRTAMKWGETRSVRFVADPNLGGRYRITVESFTSARATPTVVRADGRPNVVDQDLGPGANFIDLYIGATTFVTRLPDDLTVTVTATSGDDDAVTDSAKLTVRLTS